MNKKHSLAVVESNPLEVYLKPFSISERLFLSAVARGYTGEEARKIVKEMNIDVLPQLLRPDLQDAEIRVRQSGWYTSEEAREYWMDMLGGTFEEMMLMSGIEKLMGKPGETLNEKDMTILRAASSLIRARIEAKSRKKAVVSDGASVGDYDELILKKHRERNGRKETTAIIPVE